MLAYVFLMRWRETGLSFAAVCARVVAGIAIALAFAIPVLMNLLSNPDFGQKLDFDYRAFLRDYWPFHFFAAAQPAREIFAIIALVFIAFASALDLGRDGRRLITAMTSIVVLIWIAGAALPFLSGAPMLLNLHLLRSSLFVHFFAAIALAAATTRMLTSEIDRTDRYLWGPALVVASVIASVKALPLILVILAIRKIWPTRRVPAMPGFAILMTIAAFGVVGWRINAAQATRTKFIQSQGDWMAVADWARRSTPANAIFLLPTDKLFAGGTLPAAPPRLSALINGSEVFGPYAHRQVWVTGKQGAAVMWSPSYYKTWHARLLGALSARDLPSRMAYAHANGISEVVDDCSAAGAYQPVFHVNRLCVFKAG